MLRHALPRAVPVFLVFLLTACGQEEPVHVSTSPVLVVQPQPFALASQSYPGEVRARFDPQLAFRIGGKVTRRLVDEGERVKADQPLAELDPQDVRLQLQVNRAQVAAGQANLNLVRAERDRYKPCSIGRWSADRNSITLKTSTAPVKPNSSSSRQNRKWPAIRPAMPCCARLKMASSPNVRSK